MVETAALTEVPDQPVLPILVLVAAVVGILMQQEALEALVL